MIRIDSIKRLYGSAHLTDSNQRPLLIYIKRDNDIDILFILFCAPLDPPSHMVLILMFGLLLLFWPILHSNGKSWFLEKPSLFYSIHSYNCDSLKSFSKVLHEQGKMSTIKVERVSSDKIPATLLTTHHHLRYVKECTQRKASFKLNKRNKKESSGRRSKSHLVAIVTMPGREVNFEC